MIHSQDAKLVAERQEYEVRDIAYKFDISKDVVRAVMLKLGKNGKYCRSRRMIYKEIREMQNTTTNA